MRTNECSQPASKSSWDSQDFCDVSMVVKLSIFASPPGHNELRPDCFIQAGAQASPAEKTLQW